MMKNPYSRRGEKFKLLKGRQINKCVYVYECLVIIPSLHVTHTVILVPHDVTEIKIVLINNYNISKNKACIMEAFYDGCKVKY